MPACTSETSPLEKAKDDHKSATVHPAGFVVQVCGPLNPIASFRATHALRTKALLLAQ
jgi:hypothetical protein